MKRLLKCLFLAFFVLSLAGGLERLHWQANWDASGVSRKGFAPELGGHCAFLDDQDWVEWKVLDGEITYRCPRFGGDLALWPWFEEVRSKRLPSQYELLVGSS